MALIRGRVDKVETKKSTYGEMVFFHIDGTRYFNGKFAGGVQEGDYVELQAEQNEKGYWNVTRGSVKPIEAPAKAATPIEKPKAAASSTPSYNENRQDSIEFQSARKDSVEFLKLLVEVGAVDFGKAKGALKGEMLETLLDNYTEHFVTETKQRKTAPSQLIETSTDGSAPVKKTGPKPLEENDQGDNLDEAF